MRLRVMFALCVGALTVACGGGSSSSTTPSPSAQVTGLSIGGSNGVAVGQATQLTATASFSTGPSQSVQAAWQSSNPVVATVSSSGLVAPVGLGVVTLTATYQTTTATFTLSVFPSVAGTWVDALVTDAKKIENDATSLTWTLTQNGASVTGLATLTDPAFPGMIATGPVTGSFTNATLTFSFTLSGPTSTATKTCGANQQVTITPTGTAQVSSTAITATVTQVTETCAGTPVSNATGNFVLTFLN